MGWIPFYSLPPSQLSKQFNRMAFPPPFLKDHFLPPSQIIL